MSRRRTWRSIGRAGGPLLAVTLLVASCGGGNGEREGSPWISLARAEPERVRSVSELPRGLELTRAAGATRLALVVRRDAWTRDEETPLWRTPQPALAIGRPRAGREPYELAFSEDPGRSPRFDADVEHFGDEPGTFTVESGQLLLRLGDDEEPPDLARLSICASQHEVVADGTWRVSGRRVGGDGFAVWPGEAVRVTCAAPPRSALRFGAVLEPALLGPGQRRERRSFDVVARWDGGMAQGGATVFDEHEAVRWHELELPEDGGEVELEFSVRGAFAFTAFLDPRVVPAEAGRYGARPWEVERPDVVVFLADTFRADRMGAYGAEVPLTPNLDAVAAESLLFRNAWSVATHTLATHCTLFSGLYPRQNGQVDFFNPLPRAVDTLAERLQRIGYRTVAVTDGVMVSQTHGMAQGFAVFDERWSDLDGTLERVDAVLDDDDGRPLFLFVQTYATHAPYTVRAATRERLGDHLDAGASLGELLARLEPVPGDPQRIDRAHPGTDEVLARIRTLYDASVVDLDAAFGTLVDSLEHHGLADGGWLVVTSDHGESLGEHDRLFHAGVTYDTELRVPLFVRGPGVEPRVVERGVSLIDFAPTIADLVGLAPPAEWMGASLLDEREPAPVYAFQCRDTSEAGSTLAVIDDLRKLIGYEDIEGRRVRSWMAAFDLERDPGEVSDLFQTPTPWPSRLTEAFAPRFEPLLTPLVETEEASLTGERLRELQDMGYAGASDG